MNKLAPRFSSLGALSLVAFAAACGGNVVVDHNSSAGTGGSGASGGHSSTTSTLSAMGGSSTTVSPDTVTTGDVNPTTSTGFGGSNPVSSSTGSQQCDCNSFCKDLEQCFMIPNGQCLDACNQNMIPQSVVQCTCDSANDCNGIMNCFNMTGPGPGAGGGNPGTGGGGTGGGPPDACDQCINDSFNGTCSMQVNDCAQHQSCVDLFNCEQDCNWEPMCVQSCQMQHPGGVNRLSAVLSCSVCGQCGMECGASPIFTTSCVFPD